MARLLRVEPIGFEVRHPTTGAPMPRPESGWERALELMVPEHLRQGLVDYVLRAQTPGGFLRAVIDDQLCEAIMRADFVSREHLREIVQWLAGYAPGPCHGSAAKRRSWELYAQAIAEKVAEALVSHSVQI